MHYEPKVVKRRELIRMKTKEIFRTCHHRRLMTYISIDSHVWKLSRTPFLESPCDKP